MEKNYHVPLPQLEAVGKAFTAKFHLATADGQKKMLVTRPREFFGNKPNTVVHMGPDETDPPMSYITKESTFSENTIIHVPNGPNGEVQVRFRTNCCEKGGWKNIIHRFTMEVGPTRRPEDFEWHFVHKGPVAGLASWGFELRHVAGGRQEVVALLGKNVSFKKMFVFTLYGEGQSGVFGREWEIVALTTAIQTNKLEDYRLASAA